MVRRSSRLSLSLVVAALAGSASPALADSLPRFPGAIHLNPFATPGWFPLGAPFNVVVPVGGFSAQFGGDGLVSPFGWVWENEFDWVGLAGPVAVSVNGRPPVIMLFGPGPDLYIAIGQADVPEIGPFVKTLVNLPTSPSPIAWGTSVVEPGAAQNANHFIYTAQNGTTATMPLGSVPTGALHIRTFMVNNVLNVAIARRCPGDIDGDGKCGFFDLNCVLAQFGQVGQGLASDLNGDGRVDFADLNIVLANFGTECD